MGICRVFSWDTLLFFASPGLATSALELSVPKMLWLFSYFKFTCIHIIYNYIKIYNNPYLPFTSCVTLGLQFPHLESEDDNNTYLIGLL